MRTYALRFVLPGSGEVVVLHIEAPDRASAEEFARLLCPQLDGYADDETDE